MYTITFKGLTTDEVLARVRAGQTDDAHEKTSRWLKDSSQHHGVGIQPTVPVARTIRGVSEGRDEQLEKAIAVVSP
jgi:hypothetical protein